LASKFTGTSSWGINLTPSNRSVPERSDCWRRRLKISRKRTNYKPRLTEVILCRLLYLVFTYVESSIWTCTSTSSSPFACRT
jgi:hypothetical protein